MRFLLINTNPAVSKLINASLNRIGHEVTEISDYNSSSLDTYIAIIIDSDSYKKEYIDDLLAVSLAPSLIYLKAQDAEIPDNFQYVLKKPFLPTDFLAFIVSILSTTPELHRFANQECKQFENIPLPEGASINNNTSPKKIEKVEEVQKKEIRNTDEQEDDFKNYFESYDNLQNKKPAFDIQETINEQPPISDSFGDTFSSLSEELGKLYSNEEDEQNVLQSENQNAEPVTAKVEQSNNISIDIDELNGDLSKQIDTLNQDLNIDDFVPPQIEDDVKSSEMEQMENKEDAAFLEPVANIEIVDKEQDTDLNIQSKTDDKSLEQQEAGFQDTNADDFKFTLKVQNDVQVGDIKSEPLAKAEYLEDEKEDTAVLAEPKEDTISAEQNKIDEKINFDFNIFDSNDEQKDVVENSAHEEIASDAQEKINFVFDKQDEIIEDKGGANFGFGELAKEFDDLITGDSKEKSDGTDETKENAEAAEFEHPKYEFENVSEREMEKALQDSGMLPPAKDIDIVKTEIGQVVEQSVKGMLQSQILRDVLKGLKMNITITFEDKD
jgi:uncharacterized membrane protein